MQDKRILLVEDEKNLVDLISLNLELEGFVVKVAETGTQGLNTFREQRFDLIILDNMLPEMDGVSVCQTIRLEDSEVPILFLSAKHTSQDRITGLKSGADDYLTKPFDYGELLVRIHVLLRREFNIKSEEIELDLKEDKININIENKVVLLNQIEVHLSNTEFDLLIYLTQHK